MWGMSCISKVANRVCSPGIERGTNVLKFASFHEWCRGHCSMGFRGSPVQIRPSRLCKRKPGKHLASGLFVLCLCLLRLSTRGVHAAEDLTDSSDN
jgi:hypothetical protein